MMNLFNKTQEDFLEEKFYKPNIEHGDGFNSVSMFLHYQKCKKNPLGNPVPKQSVRSGILPRKNARVKHITEIVNGKKVSVKYYPVSDLYINSYQLAIVTNNNEHLAKQAMEIASKHDFLPFTKRICIEYLAFVYAPLKSMTKKEKNFIEQGNYIWKDTQPDLIDNLPKLIFDALEKIIFDNDGKIFMMNKSIKVYGKIPGVFIKLKGLK